MSVNQPASAVPAEAPPVPPSTRRRTGWAIRLGQSVITVALVVITSIRALTDGVSPALVIALALVFAGWYFGGLFLGDRTRDPVLATWWLVGLTLIWAGAVAVSEEFVWLAFPLWLLAGFIIRMPWAALLSVAVLAVVIAAPALHTGATTYANVIGPLVGGIFALGISRGYLQLVREGKERRRLIASLVQAQHEAAQLQDELARTQRESGAGIERTRLSRDIHDTVAQNLSSIGMIARSARAREAADTDLALTQIESLARQGLGDARRIVNDLTPSELEGSALGDALRRMLERLTEETGIRTDVRIDESVPALPMAAEVTLLRTAQSALANVRTHASASHVVVSLIDADDAVRLDVVDDGVGFDATRWDTRRPSRDEGGYGLRAMRARLREVGGNLDVESAVGEGTALSASIPLMNTGSRP
ncbi:sensor histidine kinase [Microbacterium sp. Sa4CUA7]|uniref:Sensor histidine kinase n=1 Tax=Microbacterium pullorum TaxID=2762236 RepID=A0ABR8S3X1_9MICO|nr:sensor histidine kinase [Microbacterium pullorum]MBD7958140.1 sensor histidine kinase [Microbacterium pullorum]